MLLMGTAIGWWVAWRNYIKAGKELHSWRTGRIGIRQKVECARARKL